MALALPLGMGLTALATLALGELGWLNFVGLSVLLAVLVELGIIAWFNLFREMRAWFRTRVRTRSRTSLSLFFAVCLGLVLMGTALTAVTPVTDGDALCYHLQVPKVFLMRGSVGFAPDLHETVYPLVTEMLYAVALEFRGPVACRGIQWVLGLVFAANVTALARPSLDRRAWWAGAIALSVPAVSNGMSAPLNDVALAAFGTAAIFAWVRLHERPSGKAAILAGLLAGLAIGVKYPALVLCGLLAPAIALRVMDRRSTGEAAPQATLARPGGRLSRRRPWRQGAGGICEPMCTRAIRCIPFSATSSAERGWPRCSTPSSGRFRSLRSTCFRRSCRSRSSRTDSTAFRTSSARCFCSSCPQYSFIARRAACWFSWAGVCVPRHLPDPAPEHAVSLDRAGTDVDRGRLPGEYLVPSPHCPRSVADRCLGRGHGSGGEPGGRTVAARARRLARARVGRRVSRPARADIHCRPVGRPAICPSMPG